MLARIASWVRAALPLAAAGIFAGTLWKCLAIMRDGTHFAKWGLRKGELPVISMLGVDEPEHSTFAHGFSLLSLVVVAMLVLRNHQLSREPALRNHGATRRIALVIGLLAVVALLVMAWIPGDQASHFIAALATFALLSTYAALHTGLCAVLRPNLVLLGWMVVTPAASIVFVVLWITQQDALPQYGAVAMQFAYFFALIPAFVKREPTSVEPLTVDTTSSYGASVVAVLAALWIAVLVVPVKIAELNAPLPCDSENRCFASSTDFEECKRTMLAKDYVVVRTYDFMTEYCPRAHTVQGLQMPFAKKVANSATPILFLFGLLGFVLAFFEPLRPIAVPKRRRVLARIGLALVMLAMPSAINAMFDGPHFLHSLEAIPILVLAFVALVVTWARVDRLLRGESMRGFAGPLVLAYGVIAASIAQGLAIFVRMSDLSIEGWRQMWFHERRWFLAEQSHDALEAMQLGILIALLPLCLSSVAIAFREPKAEHPINKRVLIALGIAALGHFVSIGAFKGVDVLRFFGLVPLAAFAIASWRRRHLGRMTHLVLLSSLIVANMAAILGHARPWLDALSLEDTAAFRAEIVGHLNALRFAWIRFAVDLIAYGVALGAARVRKDDSKAELLVAVGAGTATAAYAACLVFAQDVPYRAVLHTFDAYRDALPQLPEISGPDTTPVLATYLINVDGSVRYVDPDVGQALRPSELPESFSIAADRAVTIRTLEQILTPSKDLTLLLRSAAADGPPAPPEIGALGFRQADNVTRFASVSVAWMLPEYRWGRRVGNRATTTYVSINATLFDLDRPEHRMKVDGAVDALRSFLCPEDVARTLLELVLPVTDGDTVGDIVKRITDARERDPDCMFSRIIFTRDRETLLGKLGPG